jgi:solute carrier family 13 (sodium-dependent dicarboxylate transporter), member 2/3/5
MPEGSFDRWRARVGLVVAPLACLALWLAPAGALSPPAHRLRAILALVVTLWITEAVPLPVTALLGPALCVVAGVGAAREVFRSFGDPVIFVFLGSFLLADAMVLHGLNRRVAFGILGLSAIGERPGRLLAAFGAITALISMWVSNTATTAMMFPIALAILREIARLRAERSGEAAQAPTRYAAGLMLIAAFASSVGGLATPVGTPPNLIGIGLIQRTLGVGIPFFQWMAFALPLTVALVAFLIVYLNATCPSEATSLAGSAAWIRSESSRLGRLRPAERNTLVAFLVTVGLWVLPGVAALIAGSDAPLSNWLSRHVPEAVAALLGAALLFVLPTDLKQLEFTLDWEAAKRIDWGTILLFGGGLALGELMFTTGLAKALGEGLARGLDVRTPLGLVVLFTFVAVLVSEATSNTASATMVVPLAIGVAQGAGVDPLPPAIAACLGASMGSALPVSTPPNAIVYGSGYVPLLTMARHGIVLDLVGGLLIVATVTWLVPLVLR